MHISDPDGYELFERLMCKRESVSDNQNSLSNIDMTEPQQRIKKCRRSLPPREAIDGQKKKVNGQYGGRTRDLGVPYIKGY